MKKENFKKASEIRALIDSLSESKKTLINAGMNEKELPAISFRGITLNNKLVPVDFVKKYYANIDAEIANLETAFEEL